MQKARWGLLAALGFVVPVAVTATAACTVTTTNTADAGPLSTDSGSTDTGSTDSGSTDGGSPEAEADAAAPSSGFDTDDDGWTIVGDAEEAKPTYSPDGGNPDGLISAKDDAVGGVWHYRAPAKFLGDQSAQYGRLVTFDLKVTPITDPFDGADIRLVGKNGVTLVFDASPSPGTDWTHYSVKLDETAGWKKTNLTGVAPTQAELKTVLGDLAQFEIRGEFNTGADTGSLDNPTLGSTE